MTLMETYYNNITHYLQEIMKTESERIYQAASIIADYIKEDKIFFVYGPGGHSNLATQEVFFRAGGLMHVSAILDEGTLLSSGALRSMAIERTSGYGKIVIDDYNLQEDDRLIIINATLKSKKRKLKTISVSSHQHARNTPSEHTARHPSKKNLHDLTDVSIDSKVKVGDAVISIEGQEQKVGAISTFTNAFILNCI